MATDRDWGKCEELIDAVMEWIGQHWTKSMIKRQIRLIADNVSLTDRTCMNIINIAYAKIRKLYNIDPLDFKGRQIEFYRTVIRKEDEKTKNKLAAAERLDKLFGLEQIVGVDHESTARKIREDLDAMDNSIGGPDDVRETESEQKDSEHGGQSKVDAEHGTESNVQEGTGQRVDGDGRKVEDSVPNITDIEPIIEDGDISEEMAEEIGRLKDEDWKVFKNFKVGKK